MEPRSSKNPEKKLTLIESHLRLYFHPFSIPYHISREMSGKNVWEMTVSFYPCFYREFWQTSSKIWNILRVLECSDKNSWEVGLYFLEHKGTFFKYPWLLIKNSLRRRRILPASFTSWNFLYLSMWRSALVFEQKGPVNHTKCDGK